MNDDQLRVASEYIEGKLNSLENDFARAYVDLENLGIAPAPFPMVMYSMSVMDCFSSLRAGWSDGHGLQGRSQTQRIINYLVDCMGYQRQPAIVLVNIYRHQLMHTSDPRTIRDTNTQNVYGWGIANTDPNHMQLIEYPSPLNPQARYFQLHFGISEFIADLREGSEQYLVEMRGDQDLQNNYENCMIEINNKAVDLGA